MCHAFSNMRSNTPYSSNLYKGTNSVAQIVDAKKEDNFALENNQFMTGVLACFNGEKRSCAMLHISQKQVSQVLDL